MTFSFGKIFKITVFGESHGKCVGVVIEGCPPGLQIDKNSIQKELDLRKPGKDVFSSQRIEMDQLVELSGTFNGRATGAPIVLMVRNNDIDSNPYKEIKDTPRPGHADFTAKIKYHNFNDYRGGGIFSGRITVAFVMAGAIAKQILSEKGIKIHTHCVQVGEVKLSRNVSGEEIEKYVKESPLRCAEKATSEKMMQQILNAKNEGDSVGGIIECRIDGVPAGIGEPLFDSIESIISSAIFSIPAVKGIEFGSGFKSAEMRGSEHNDSFIMNNGEVQTETNNNGGILGGISNGMPIVFRVAIKPTASISKVQKTMDLATNKECALRVRGRHDPCIVPRAVSVVESMAALCITDLLLRSFT
jgi:chorismate synthase